MDNRFKDTQNRWVTSGLFKETAATNKSFVIMTLDEGRERFIECGDPTGVVFADKWLGSYMQWVEIKSCKALAKHIREWEEELEARIRSGALLNIYDQAGDGHFQASKFLMDRGWEKRKAGKPSKAEVERETRVQAKVKEGWSNDISRIKRD